MKILCISDETVPQLENVANLRRRYNDVDLVISCGDLSVAYLDLITTILGKPLMYVRGNHDERYNTSPPGGIDLHENFVEYKGVTFIGLEGCLRYNRGKIQYTQTEMHTKVFKLAPYLSWRRWRKSHAVDVFVTHAPARGIHDLEDDYPHRGFDAYLRFMDWYRPRFMIHGHVHTWDRRKSTRTNYKNTMVMNIMPFAILEIEE